MPGKQKIAVGQCFGWFQRNHVWKAPTSTFHQNLFLPGLLQPVSRSKGPKCARLSAPSLCATVLVGFKETMYGKPQPVPFTRTFLCQDCSNQFRDPRVQSVLDYPPPHSAPLFWLVSRKPCMESPNQYLSPEPFLPGLLQPVSRSKGPKCARLSAPSLCATVLVRFRETMYGKPQPVPLTRTFFCQDCSNRFRDPRVQSVLDYPPPHLVGFKGTMYGKPQLVQCARLSAPSLCATILVGFRETMYGKHFCQDCSNQFRDPRVQSVLDYPPPPSVPLFWLVSRKPCMESPNQYLSPEPQDCSNQFRDPRVQSVLDYPPPHSAPLFW